MGIWSIMTDQKLLSGYHNLGYYDVYCCQKNSNRYIEQVNYRDYEFKIYKASTIVLNDVLGIQNLSRQTSAFQTFEKRSSWTDFASDSLKTSGSFSSNSTSALWNMQASRFNTVHHYKRKQHTSTISQNIFASVADINGRQRIQYYSRRWPRSVPSVQHVKPSQNELTGCQTVAHMSIVLITRFSSLSNVCWKRTQFRTAWSSLRGTLYKTIFKGILRVCCLKYIKMTFLKILKKNGLCWDFGICSRSIFRSWNF